MKEVIKQIVESTRFYKEGGSCFECCDYEGMVKDLYEKVEQFREQTYKQGQKDLVAKMVEVRDLSPKEKGKTTDFWEGYTYAITKLNKLLNN